MSEAADRVGLFEAQRPRLTRLADRMLSDRVEAQDIVQQAWLRWSGTDQDIDNVPAWLTTVTTRLCLDRLKARVPVPEELGDDVGAAHEPDAAATVMLGESVGDALGVVLDRLTPAERVALVMHDTFDFDFPTIADALEVSPGAARKLASRARAKVRDPAPTVGPADWDVIDAFMTAARGGEYDRLIELLAPDARVRADAAAIATGTPQRIDGSVRIAEFFNGAARAALPASLDGRGVFAWFHRGEARVVFDFTVTHGAVESITFRADPVALARVVRRP